MLEGVPQETGADQDVVGQSQPGRNPSAEKRCLLKWGGLFDDRLLGLGGTVSGREREMSPPYVLSVELPLWRSMLIGET